MHWYTSLIASHPVVIIVAVAVFSISCTIISLTAIRLPDFSDPQLGFEVRGSEIANRLTAWQNLIEATRASGQLAVNPLDESPPHTHNPIFQSLNALSNSKKKTATNRTLVTSKWSHEDSDTDSELSNILGVVRTEFQNNTRHKENSAWVELVRTLKESDTGINEDEDFDDGQDHFHDDHNHFADDGFFCASGPGTAYSRAVISIEGEDNDLFSLPALMDVCRIQQYLVNGPHFPTLCEQARHGQCCQPWSLPNYVAMLRKRSSCLNITEEDVKVTKELIENCSHHYYNMELMPDVVYKERSSTCHSHNAVYNLMHYILDSSFMPSKTNVSNVLSNTVIFLPMARTSAALDLYQSLDGSQLRNGAVYVSAMDFGLKNKWFDHLLIRDTQLVAMAAGFVLCCMWFYTRSLFVTLMTIVAIGFSLSIAYFIYTIILDIRSFPFMNLLTLIVAVGIGADDAFILSKMWQCTKSENCNLTMEQLVHITMKHSTLSMFVTTITTAAAFFSSFVSAVTAIRCFSLFAGLAVIVNYGLMETWLPACMVVSERICWAPPVPFMCCIQRKLSLTVATLNKLLVSSVLHLRHLWICLLTALALASIFIVCYSPRLQLPDSADFQLFASRHPFELYDSVYKHKFWFEKPQKVDNENIQMPLRFVWGIRPEDNGDHLDPMSRGTLRFDSTFDIASPHSQTWLLKFCRNLRAQPFFEVTLGLILPNCFIESYVDWMNRRCQDSVERKSRAPCCESAKFPFNRRVFHQCLVEATRSLYRTPRNIFSPGAAGPKFSRVPNTKGVHKVKVVVVEFDSNVVFSTSYTKMHSLFTQVETFMQQQLATAPPGMRNGFFVSLLQFYDLQNTLAQDTVFAIIVSLVVSLAVLITVTLNVVVSLYTILSIMSIIFVTVAYLVLIGWKLNVLESVAVSVAIGLAVDFSLHYAVNYRMCPENECRKMCVRHSLNIMAGPSLMAALTTAAAGAFMLPSDVLPYIQIGIFLVVVMVVSWLYSTYFLMGLLAIIGPQRNFGQLSCPTIRGLLTKQRESSCPRGDRTVYVNVLSESNLSSSSMMCALHNVSGEAHELEALNKYPSRPKYPRSGSVSQPSSRKVSLPAEQSPSATSATTIIHDDD